MGTLAWHDFQWCLQRAPRAVVQALKDNPGKVFVAGGYIRACIANEHVNDIDLFVGSKEFGHQIAEKIANGHKVHSTDNAFTVTHSRIPVQIIHRWTFEKPEDCIASFDFTIAQAAFWFRGGNDTIKANWESICAPRFYQDLASKRLIYTSPVREEEAGGSMLRVLKFYQRGYRIPLDSLGAVMARLAIAVQWDRVDEGGAAKILTGLLREVDPNIDPTHLCHLPSEPEDEAETNDA